MKVKPHQAFRVLGTSITLDPTKVYDASPADQPYADIERGLIFVHERDDDPVGVMLREGEYTVIEP